MSYFFPFVINPSHDFVKKNSLLLELAEQLSQDYTQRRVTETSLKTIGALLWQSLQIDEQFNQLYQEHQLVALIIQSQDQQIHRLPWECLYHPMLGFLGKQVNFILSRCFLNQQVINKFDLSTPVQILLFSLPHKELQLEFEQYEIYQVLRNFIDQGKVELFICDNGDFTHFQALLQHQMWHLILFSGHQLVTADTKESFFVFENSQGQKEVLSASDIAPLFQSAICVVLLACQTAQFSQKSPFALQLTQWGIPYVIGMQEEILDRATIIFVKNFLMCLLQQGHVDIAVQYGRAQMTQLLVNNEVWHDFNLYQGQWVLPVLLNNDLVNNLTISPTVSKLMPIFLRCNMPASSVLIGRRKGVQNLLKIIETDHYSQLIVIGVRGIGKTTFVDHVVNRLYLKGYNIFACRASTLVELTDALLKWLKITDFDHYQIKTALIQMKEQKWIIWLDQINVLQYMGMSNFFEQLSHFSNFHVLMTSHQKFLNVTDCYKYYLTQLDFEDFVRYIHYLGLPYENLQIRLLYKFSAGNFKAIQLLQTMPISKTGKEFMLQLFAIQRYLQAYLRQDC